MKKNTTMAFGVEPNRRTFRLRLARYAAAANTAQDLIARHEQANSETPFRILDVGVGPGRLMRYVDSENELRNVKWTGVDNCSKRLQSVFEADRWQLDHFDIERGLPYPDQSFDLVVCEQVLEHLKDPASVLKSIAGVLIPGGRAIIGVPVFFPGIARLRKTWEELNRLYLGRVSSHPQTFTSAKLLKMCIAAGLVPHDVQGFRMFSGGPTAFLENYRWWYRTQRWFGARLPSLCTEVQVFAVKPTNADPNSPTVTTEGTT